MSYWLLSFSSTLSLTIDRLEGPFAIIEWPNEALTAIENSLLPFSIQEGCQIQLSLYPSPYGAFHAIHEDPSILNRLGIPFIIPMENITRPGFSYWLSFKRLSCGEMP